MSKLKGNSTEALVNSNNAQNSKEKVIELFGSLVQKMQSGNIDIIEPFVIGAKDGNLIVEKCTVDENGKISIPEISVNTADDIKAKSKFVRKIMKEISPVLHADIDNVTYTALMRKDSEKLQKMMLQVKSGTKAKLENRVGCIWLVIGDYEVVI